MPGRTSALATASTPGTFIVGDDPPQLRILPISSMSEVDEIFAALGQGGAKGSESKSKDGTKNKDDAKRKGDTKRKGDAKSKDDAKRKDGAKRKDDGKRKSDDDSGKKSKKAKGDASTTTATSTSTEKDASAKGTHAEPKPTKPKTRVPTVVHDTSSAARKPAQPAPKQLDNDDAAFADSRGKDRTSLFSHRRPHRGGIQDLYRGRAQAEPGRRYVVALLTQTRRCVLSTATAVGPRPNPGF